MTTETANAVRYRILTAITLGYGLTYTCRLAIGVIKKPLIDGGVFTAGEFGTIGSALFLAYAIGKFFNGFIADHINVRLFVVAGFVLSALCCVGMGATTGVAMAALLWGLNGWFQSCGAPGSVIALTAAFPDAQRGRAYGIWSTSHSIGEGLTFLAVTAAVTWWGWRWGYWSAAALSGIAALLALVLIPNLRHPRRTGEVGSRPIDVLKAQVGVLAIPSIWVLGLASALIYVTRYAINSWGVLYLQEARGMSLTAAGTLILISNLAGIAGAVAYGYCSDLIFKGRRPPANLIFAIVEIVGMLVIFYGPGTTPVLVLGMVLFGLGMTGLVTATGLFATDLVPKRVVGAALGVIGTFSYVGSAIQEQVSGILIDRGTTTVAGAHHYDFSAVVAFWIGASVASMVLALLLWRQGRAYAAVDEGVPVAA